MLCYDDDDDDNDVVYFLYNIVINVLLRHVARLCQLRGQPQFFFGGGGNIVTGKCTIAIMGCVTSLRMGYKTMLRAERAENVFICAFWGTLL